jgi:hypothetical protein
MYTITLIAAILLLVLTGFSTNLCHKAKPVKESKYLSFICSFTTFITIIAAWIFSVMLLIEIIGSGSSKNELKQGEINNKQMSISGSLFSAWIK